MLGLAADNTALGTMAIYPAVAAINGFLAFYPHLVDAVEEVPTEA